VLRALHGMVDLIYRGYAGVPINPNTTSVSFIPRGEMNGEPKLKLLVNVINFSYIQTDVRVNQNRLTRS
jgi:hypothetical protein